MDQFATFAYVAAFGGGACILVSVMTGSIIPLGIGAVALFCILAFMNGMAAGPVALPAKRTAKR